MTSYKADVCPFDGRQMRFVSSIAIEIRSFSIDAEGWLLGVRSRTTWLVGWTFVELCRAIESAVSDDRSNRPSRHLLWGIVTRSLDRLFKVRTIVYRTIV